MKNWLKYSFLFLSIGLVCWSGSASADDYTITGNSRKTVYDIEQALKHSLTSADTITITQGNQLWINSATNVKANAKISGTGWYSSEYFGAIRFAVTGSSFSGNIELTGDARIGIRNGDVPCNGLITGNISGDYQLELSSTRPTDASDVAWAGSLILAGTNSYGATKVSNGTIQLGNGGTTGSFGTGAVTLASKAGIAFNRSDDYTISNTISGGNLMTQLGSGILTVDGSKITGFTGNYAVSNGTLTWTNQTSVTKNVTTSGSGQINWGSVTSATGTVTIGSAMDLSALYPDGFTYTTKPSIVSGGVLNIGTTSTADALAKVTMNGGALKATSTEAMIIGTGTIQETVNLIRDMPVQLNGGTNTVDVPGGVTAAYAQGITNAPSATGQKLVKTGAGTLALQTASTYDGGTDVQGGTLDVTAGVPAGAISIASGATLKSGALTSATNKLTVSGTWHVVATSKDQIGLTSSGLFKGQTINKGATLAIEGWRTAGTDFTYVDSLGITLDVKKGGQIWTSEQRNISTPIIIAGDTWGTERRGAIRFQYSNTESGGMTSTEKMTVLTGGVQLSADAMICAFGDNAGALLNTFAAIASPITGDYTLTVSSSNAADNRIYFLGTNTYKYTKIEAPCQLILGHTGTINGVAYDGKTGTLGTGNTTVNANATLTYARVNEYAYNATLTNNGKFNIKSGTFKLRNAQNTLTGSGTTTISEGAVLKADQWTAFYGTDNKSSQKFDGAGEIRVGTYNGEHGITPTKNMQAVVDAGGKVGAVGNRGGITWSNGTDVGMNYLTDFWVWDTAQIYVAGSGNYGVNTTTIHLEGVGWRASTNENKGALRFNSGWGGTPAAPSTSAEKMYVFQNNFQIEPYSATVGNTKYTMTRIGVFVDKTDWTSYGMIAGSLLGSADLEIRNNGGDTLVLTGDNSAFTGNIYITNGGTTQIGTTCKVNGTEFNGGTLGSGNTEVSANCALVIDRQKGTGFEYSGVLTNKGQTTIQSGVLTLSPKQAAAAALPAMESGTTPLLASASPSSMSLVNTGTLTVSPDGVLEIGNDSTPTALTVSGSNGKVRLNGTLAMTVFSPTSYDSLTFTNQTVSVGEGSVLALDFLGDESQYTGSAFTLNGILSDAEALKKLDIQLSNPNLKFVVNGSDLTIGTAAALPEPATWVLLLAGMGLLHLRTRKNH